MNTKFKLDDPVRVKGLGEEATGVIRGIKIEYSPEWGVKSLQTAEIEYKVRLNNIREVNAFSSYRDSVVWVTEAALEFQVLKYVEQRKNKS